MKKIIFCTLLLFSSAAYAASDRCLDIRATLFPPCGKGEERVFVQGACKASYEAESTFCAKSDGGVEIPSPKFVEVAFGIRLPKLDENKGFIFDESGEVVMQSLYFQFFKKLSSVEATKEAASMCSIYVNWVSAGRYASPQGTNMAVFVLLAKKYEDGDIDLLDTVDFPRTKTPFDSAFDPFSSKEDCAEKIAPALHRLSQEL